MTQPTDETGVHRPVAEPVDRRGWLPIRTNAFDRWFIAVVVLIAIHLLWMRFVEAYVPLFVATAMSLFVGYGIIRHG